MANHEADESTNSREEDWKFLDQSIRKENEKTKDNDLNDEEIPAESALDEVDAYVDDSYNDILNDKINQSSNETAITNVAGGEVMDEIEVEMKNNAINYEGELDSELELDSILTDDSMDLDKMLEDIKNESNEEMLSASVPEQYEGNNAPVVELEESLLDDFLKEINEQQSEAPVDESVNEVVEDTAEEAKVEEAEAVMEEVTEETTEEPVEETMEESAEDLVEEVESDLPEELLEEVEADLSDDLLEDLESEIAEDLLEELEEELSEDILEEINEVPTDEVASVEEDAPIEEAVQEEEAVPAEDIDSVSEDLLKEIEDILPEEFLEQVEEEQSGSDSMMQVEPLDDMTMSLDEFDALLGDTHLDDANEDELDLSNKTKTASDIFSDSLGAVSSLEDQELEETFNSLLPDMEEAKEQEAPKTLMQKMFANIEPENPEEEIAAAKEQFEKKEEEKKAKAEEKAKKKEEKKKAAEEKKAAKAAEKEAKAKLKAEKKAELLAKKQKEKEEFEKNYVPEGKINKIGASIVFGTAAVIGTSIVMGSFRGSHSLTVDTAQFNTQIGRYTQAYEALNGLELSGSDEYLYDQVNTVMVMKKQMNSYEHFKELKMDVEAIDSLLKGLERYDAYYDQAKKFDVADQYDKLKSKFSAELMKTYGVNDADAKALIAEKDPVAYTKALSNICSLDASTENK